MLRPWGRLRVWVSGGGPKTIVALHGLGGSGRYWHGLAAALGAEWTVVAPDLGGFGSSDKPDVAYDRSFHLANVDAVVEVLAERRLVVLVGHSLGGVLAALWAARRPHRVAALGLVAAPCPTRERARPWREPARRHPKLTWWHEAQAAVWSLAAAALPVSPYPRAVIADYARHTRDSYRRTMQHLVWDAEIETELQGLRHLGPRPGLVLTGSHDRRVGPECADRWMTLLPHAQRVTVPYGHQLLLSTRFRPLVDWIRQLVVIPEDWLAIANESW